MKMFRYRRLSASLLLPLLLAVSQTEARLYRWVDAEGNVHFSDHLPPQEAQRAHEELDSSGVRVRVVPRAKTPEEIAKERELARLRAEQQRLIEEQKARDRVLLRTFRSEDDLILARDGKLAAVDVLIKVTQGNIRRYQTRLGDLQRRAADLERAGRTVPRRLLENIAATRRAIEDAYAQIGRREREKDLIRQAFAKDLERFRELKHLTASRQTQERQEGATLSNLVPCGTEKVCERRWARARAFVRERASTPVQMEGENILVTAPPRRDDDIAIAVSRLRDRDSGRISLFLDLRCKDSSIGARLCASPKVAAIRKAFRAEMLALGESPTN